MHDNSVLLFKKYAREHFCNGMRVLEIGPDKFPSTYQSIVGDPSIGWDTLDLYKHKSLTYQSSSEYEFRIPDGAYDIVLSGQVLEHVRKPWIWMKELSRVTKENGLIITINPVSWVYHEAPIDCWRVYPDGIRALSEDVDIDIEFSVTESLETPNYKRFIPGISMDSQSFFRKFMYKAMGFFGMPVERSYDTISIGRKITSIEVDKAI